MGATTKSIADSHTAFIAQPVTVAGFICRRTSARGPPHEPGRSPTGAPATPTAGARGQPILGNLHQPGLGQLQVQISAFPIHPGDLLAISASSALAGQQIAGIEATGVVTRSRRRGHRLQPWYPGQLLPALKVHRARSSTSTPRSRSPVPDSVPDEVAAQMLCNPITALLLRRAAQRHCRRRVRRGGAEQRRSFVGGPTVHRYCRAPPDRHGQHRAQRGASPPATGPLPHGASGFHLRPGLGSNRCTRPPVGQPIPVALDPVGGTIGARPAV